MRYELSLIAYDLLDQVNVSARCYGTGEHIDDTTEPVWAMTATTRVAGSPSATEWIREVLETTLAGL